MDDRIRVVILENKKRVIWLPPWQQSTNLDLSIHHSHIHWGWPEQHSEL
jgi:hypothetical protein